MHEMMYPNPTTMQHQPASNRPSFHHTMTMANIDDVGGGGFQRPPSTNTYTGVRGGTAEDEQLLAELRAISMKSSSSRFAGDDDDEVVAGGSVPATPMPSNDNDDEHSGGDSCSGNMNSMPIQIENNICHDAKLNDAVDEQDGAMQQQHDRHEPAKNDDDDDGNAFGNRPNDDVGIQSTLPNSFTGSRGGDAVDDELLAELRAISNKSSGSNRFDFDGNEGRDDGAFSNSLESHNAGEITDNKKVEPRRIAIPPLKSSGMSKNGVDKQSDSLPPWKRNNAGDKPWKRGAIKKSVDGEDMDIVIAAPPAPARTSSNSTPKALLHDVEVDAQPEVVATEKSANPADGIIDSNEQLDPPMSSRSDGGFQSTLPNTFTGSRGGAAVDDELLAELRAISNKSSGRNRFDGNADRDDGAPTPTITGSRDARDVVDDNAAEENKLNKNGIDKNSDTLPPWKRKAAEKPWKRGGAMKKMVGGEDMDIVIAAPPARSNPQLEHTPKKSEHADSKVVKEQGIQSNLPKTFVGDRGGAAEDPDLLAELRAISSKTASRNRFDDGEDNGESEIPIASDGDVLVDDSEEHYKVAKRGDVNGSLVVEERGIQSNLPKTFVGDRGGAAEDPDLLAELRGISSKTASRNRFDDGDDNGESEIPIASDGDVFGDESKEYDKVAKRGDVNGSLVVEERGIQSNLPKTFVGDRGGAAEDPDLLAELRAISSKTASRNRFDDGDDNGESEIPIASDGDVFGDESKEYDKVAKRGDVNGSLVVEERGIQSTLPKTFVGDQGGAAEDPDLLAELKTISSKTASRNRFDDGDGESGIPVTSEGVDESKEHDTDVLTKPKSIDVRKMQQARPLPPWKQKKGVKVASLVEDVVVAPTTKPSCRPFQNALIDENSEEGSDVRERVLRGASEEENTGIARLASNAPASTERMDSRMNPNLPNTVKGDRGGSAEDAKLLAELMAVSMKSSSNRFDDGDDEASSSAPFETARRSETTGLDERYGEKPRVDNNMDASSAPLPQWKQIRTNQKSPGPSEDTGKVDNDESYFPNKAADCATSNDEDVGKSNVEPSNPSGTLSSYGQGSLAFGMMGQPPPSNTDADIKITLEGLVNSLKSTNWQERKASYLFLHGRITTLSIDSGPTALLNSGEVYESLDKAVIHSLNDKNAGALDAALTLAITYADRCDGACSDDTALQIVTTLVKGTAFSSSRSSTLSQTEELVLKLVEIAPEGSSSIEVIFDLIQAHGLKSVKPKVVIFAAKLIMKSVLTFGASVLPIRTLKTSSECLIAHSNAQAREIGMQLLAEMCRALGSKDPFQNVIENLKKSQQSQLDSLLEAQPIATAVSRRLRRNMGKGPTTSRSHEEALESLKRAQEEDNVKRLAARPAVDLFQVLPRTCYREKIRLDKWSEKVAALDALIEAGGEQPYKLCRPGGSVDYAPLISELKKLLSHTHFAVCSKALTALGMLAEGVGEQIFSSMRPLIPTIVALLKDKKVINAVGNCLDKMFANVFSFENLLDNKDSLPSAVDEKKQKNALVRKNVLDYLVRCIAASGTYGTRGDITIQYASDLTKLACETLADSDAATRKAATDVVLALLKCKDGKVVSATTNMIASLQATNPRAYKLLKLATDGGDKAPTRPRSAPEMTSAHAFTQVNSSERKINSVNPAGNPVGLSKPISGSVVSEDDASEKSLPSFDDSVQILSALNIAKWGDDIDNGGVLAGIRSSNWKARMGALNQLMAHYAAADQAGVLFHSIPSLFVFVKDCSKSFNESNFNVAKALLELFTAIFGIHKQLLKVPESYLYVPATKLAVEKVGDKKLTEASSSCLHSICIVKDPQKVVEVAVKALSHVKSPLAHEALLCWFKTFCLDFGSASLSIGIQDSLIWVLQECESNNMKVREAALNVIGVMNSQLGPVLQACIKAKTIESSTMKLLDKAISDHPYDAKDSCVEKELKCITMLSSNDMSSQPAAKSILSLPKTDIMASLRSDYLDRLNSTEGKTAWKIRRDAMEEIRVGVEKCGALIATEGNSFLSLKQLFAALRSRLNDSQSNLKPAAASLIGMLLNHVDDDSQAKLGKIVFAALIHAAANDMKKTMREAAIAALAMGTESSVHNGGGTNLIATECFIICLESTMSEATLKSSGLPDVISFLTAKLESLYPNEETGKRRAISVNRQLAKVIVLCLLSSKAGTRSAAESLLGKCTTSRIVLSEDFDKEIGQLLPAQQRTVRSVIPTLAKQEQPVRPSSSSRLPTMQARPKSNQLVIAPPAHEVLASETCGEANPLRRGTTNSTKKQRLLQAKSDNWPEYPEQPNGDTLLSICKAWSQLISPVSIQLLFPKDGLRSHEDAISGCDLISTAIEYSRSNNDDEFLEELDLIFKWTACALYSRDHTSGLRSLISMLQLLFKRLRELSYVMTDYEAIILLPTILEKTGNAKSQCRDQLIDTLSFIRLNELYQLPRYGSIICMKVLEKSNSTRARSLAANECISCVKVAGTVAIGKRGVETLARALSTEKFLEVRTSYLDLFENVVQKSSLEKVLKLCVGDTVTEKTRGMIIDRCSRRPSTTPAPDGTKFAHRSDQRQSRLTPTRKSVTAGSNQVASSSSAVTGALKLRLQRLKVENQTAGGSSHIPSTTSVNEDIDFYASALNGITGMMNDEVTIEQGLQAIRRLGSEAKTEIQKFSSDVNRFVEIFAGALKFAFKRSTLHISLIQETVDSLTHVFRTPQYYSAVSQDSLECCIREAVHALLDDRLDASKGANTDGIDIIIKGINKMAMRAATSPSRETSLSALLSLQRATISSDSQSEFKASRVSRVYTKLFARVVKDEYERNPTNPLGEVELDFLLYSLDWLLQTINEFHLSGGSRELAKHAEEMSNNLMTELVKCRGNSVREALSQLELPDCGLIEELMTKCEQEISLSSHPPLASARSADGISLGQGASGTTEGNKARFAQLVNNFAKAETESDKQVALIALVDFRRTNGIDFDAQLTHLSPHFKDFILEQVGKSSKENATENVHDAGSSSSSFNERMKNLRLKVGQDQASEEMAVTDKAASLRLRLEALKYSKG